MSLLLIAILVFISLALISMGFWLQSAAFAVGGAIFLLITGFQIMNSSVGDVAPFFLDGIGLLSILLSIGVVLIVATEVRG